jgi:hypothetical protein
VVREFEGGSFKTGSRSASVAFPRPPSIDTVNRGGTGPETGQVLRVYENGFAGPDQGGTTPGSLFAGTTSRFGYADDAQNDGDRSLTFTQSISGTLQTSSFRTSESDASWRDDPETETGLRLATSFQTPVNEGRVSVGVRLSAEWVPFEMEGGGQTFAATRTTRRFNRTGTLTDTYAVPGGVTLPLAPYSQPSATPGPGFLPRIIDTPTRSETLETVPVATTWSEWWNRVDERFEADVFTFSLAPELSVEPAPGFLLTLSGGPALHLVDWTAGHTETLYRSVNGGPAQTDRVWNDRADDTEVLWGGFVEGSAGLRFGKDSRYLLQAFLRADWAESLSGEVGPSRFQVGLDSLSAGLVGGVAF